MKHIGFLDLMRFSANLKIATFRFPQCLFLFSSIFALQWLRTGQTIDKAKFKIIKIVFTTIVLYYYTFEMTKEITIFNGSIKSILHGIFFST
jgi:hypothetical protein